MRRRGFELLSINDGSVLEQAGWGWRSATRLRVARPVIRPSGDIDQSCCAAVLAGLEKLLHAPAGRLDWRDSAARPDPQAQPLRAVAREDRGPAPGRLVLRQRRASRGPVPLAREQ